MTDPQDEAPKIIVDSDWKEQARKEQEAQDAETREAAAGGEIPDPSIEEIAHMIIMQVTVSLGGMADPRTGQPLPSDMPVAKHYIDLLDLLIEKTRGNLEEEEEKRMSGVLHELRMAFVQIAGAGGGSGPSPSIEE